MNKIVAEIISEANLPEINAWARMQGVSTVAPGWGGFILRLDGEIVGYHLTAQTVIGMFHLDPALDPKHSIEALNFGTNHDRLVFPGILMHCKKNSPLLPVVLNRGWVDACTDSTFLRLDRHV